MTWREVGWWVNLAEEDDEQTWEAAIRDARAQATRQQWGGTGVAPHSPEQHARDMDRFAQLLNKLLEPHTPADRGELHDTPSTAATTQASNTTTNNPKLQRGGPPKQPRRRRATGSTTTVEAVGDAKRVEGFFNIWFLSVGRGPACTTHDAS